MKKTKLGQELIKGLKDAVKYERGVVHGARHQDPVAIERRRVRVLARIPRIPGHVAVATRGHQQAQREQKGAATA